MKNYEYIIAGLPDITAQYRGELDCDGIIAQIRELLDRKDASVLDKLLAGFEPDNLTPEFYGEALCSPQKFIRQYFEWDLGVRNARVAFLNSALGRDEGTDIMVLPGEESPREFEKAEKVRAALEGASDLIERERAMDELMWDEIEEMTLMDVFTLDKILSFVARLQIVARWLRLDEQTGRELFAKLVSEIRNNKKPIE